MAHFRINRPPKMALLASSAYPRNLKLKIKECEEKLDRLLDTHLEQTFSSEEYVAKKRVLLDTKIDFDQKLKDFERNGNRWLELCRTFIKDANQAEIVASSENLEAKRDFLLKVGSNPRLRARALFATPKKSFAILAEFPYSARSAPLGSENSEGYLSLLAALNDLRTPSWVELVPFPTLMLQDVLEMTH